MQVKHTFGKVKPFALFSQAGELFQIRGLWRRGEKSEMQSTRGDYRIRKWIFCDGLGECFEGKYMYIWLKATALQNFGGELRGKPGKIIFSAFEHGVATLNICPDPLRTYFFQGGDKLIHRQRAVATHIDAAEKGNVRIHAITV